MSRRAVAQSLTLMAAWLRPSRPINAAPRPRGARQLVFLRDCAPVAHLLRVCFLLARFTARSARNCATQLWRHISP